MTVIFVEVDEKPKSSKQILLEKTKPPKNEQGKHWRTQYRERAGGAAAPA